CAAGKTTARAKRQRRPKGQQEKFRSKDSFVVLHLISARLARTCNQAHLISQQNYSLHPSSGFQSHWCWKETSASVPMWERVSAGGWLLDEPRNPMVIVLRSADYRLQARRLRPRLCQPIGGKSSVWRFANRRRRSLGRCSQG